MWCWRSLLRKGIVMLNVVRCSSFFQSVVVRKNAHKIVTKWGHWKPLLEDRARFRLQVCCSRFTVKAVCCCAAISAHSKKLRFESPYEKPVRKQTSKPNCLLKTLDAAKETPLTCAAFELQPCRKEKRYVVQLWSEARNTARSCHYWQNHCRGLAKFSRNGRPCREQTINRKARDILAFRFFLQ